MIEIIQNILSNIQTPWAAVIAAVLVAFFPVKNPDNPDKGQFLIQRLLKFFRGRASSSGNNLIGSDNQDVQFASCQEAIHYLANCAHEARDTELRDAALDLLRPFARMRFPDRSQANMPGAPRQQGRNE